MTQWGRFVNRLPKSTPPELSRALHDVFKDLIESLPDFVMDLLARASQIIFQPVAGQVYSRTVEDKLRDVVSVKDFGAVGDGVANDTAAIAAALAAGAGKTVYLPAGYYAISDDLLVPSNTRLRGAGRGVTIVRRRTGAATYLVGNSDKVVGNSNITVEGITFDGMRTGSVDIPARWCAYFSRVTDLAVRNCEFKSADSDGLTLEFVNGGIVTGNLCHDNVKPGIYLSCCDHVTVTHNTVRDCIQSIAYGIALASSWFCTIANNVVWNAPNASIGLARDSRFNVISGNALESIGTEIEAMPSGYASYLATVTRPNRGLTDGTTLYGAFDNIIVGNVIANTVTAADKNGINLRNSHRNQIIGNTIAEHGRCGIHLQGSSDTVIARNKILNVGKNLGTRWAILGFTQGVRCDRTVIDDNEIDDNQGTVTSYGIQIADNACVGVIYRDNCVRLPAFALYEDGTTALAAKIGNQFGTSALPRVAGYVAMSGTANRGTAYATGTITLVQLAERVKAMQDDLTALGIVNAP